MSRLTAALFVLLLPLSCTSGINLAIDAVSERLIFGSSNVGEPAYKVAELEPRDFVTRDGVRLVADCYLPEGLSKAPTILVRIPFTNTYSNYLRSKIIARHWATRGYAVVLQGTRGRYKSEGDFYPLLSEESDGLETIKWLRQQSWYDGRILMWGGSSFGHTQWVLADKNLHDLKAFSIQIASSNFRKMFYPGGAFSLESALFWAMRSHGSKDREVDMSDLNRGAWHLPLLDSDNEAAGDIGFYNDWLVNSDNPEFWRKIDGLERSKKISSPVLLLAGWYDPFLNSQLDDYYNISNFASPEIAARSRLIIGPWSHADEIKLPGYDKEIPYRQFSVLSSTEWFDFILSKESKPIPKVRIFVMGANIWRSENEWPLKRTVYTDYFLGSSGSANTLNGDGSLSLRADSSKETDIYTYDPVNPVPSLGGASLSSRAGVRLQNEVEKRNDVLVYSTQELTVDTEISGPIKVTLYVRTTAANTDFTAKLVDVHPDGSAYNIAEGILRKDYQQPQVNPEAIEIELNPSSNLFKSGHKIRLEISSSSFPRFDRNTNTGKRFYQAEGIVKAEQTIYHSPQYLSKITLPIIPK